MNKGFSLSIEALSAEAMLYAKLSQYSQIILQLAQENERLKADSAKAQKDTTE